MSRPLANVLAAAIVLAVAAGGVGAITLVDRALASQEKTPDESILLPKVGMWLLNNGTGRGKMGTARLITSLITLATTSDAALREQPKYSRNHGGEFSSSMTGECRAHTEALRVGGRSALRLLGHQALLARRWAEENYAPRGTASPGSPDKGGERNTPPPRSLPKHVERFEAELMCKLETFGEEQHPGPLFSEHNGGSRDYLKFACTMENSCKQAVRIADLVSSTSRYAREDLAARLAGPDLQEVVAAEQRSVSWVSGSPPTSSCCSSVRNFGSTSSKRNQHSSSHTDAFVWELRSASPADDGRVMGLLVGAIHRSQTPLAKFRAEETAVTALEAAHDAVQGHGGRGGAVILPVFESGSWNGLHAQKARMAKRAGDLRRPQADNRWETYFEATGAEAAFLDLAAAGAGAEFKTAALEPESPECNLLQKLTRTNSVPLGLEQEEKLNASDASWLRGASALPEHYVFERVTREDQWVSRMRELMQPDSEVAGKKAFPVFVVGCAHVAGLVHQLRERGVARVDRRPTANRRCGVGGMMVGGVKGESSLEKLPEDNSTPSITQGDFPFLPDSDVAAMRTWGSTRAEAPQALGEFRRMLEKGYAAGLAEALHALV